MSVLFVLIILAIVLSLPSIQTAIAKRVTGKINKQYGVNISIDRVKIALFYGDVSLNDVYIEDHKNDTLIYINELHTSILSARNTIKGRLKFGDMEVEELVLNMKTYRGEKDTNLDVFIKKLESSDTTQVSEDPFLLSSSHITIRESAYRLTDENTEDAEILNFNHINAEIHDFKIEGSNVDGDISELAFKWSNGLIVRDLATKFSYARDKMQFNNFSITTVNSGVEGNISFEYEREDLADFINKVKINAVIDRAVVSSDEMNLFYNEFGNGKKVEFSSSFTGVLNELEALDLYAISESTVIDGDFHFHNLFNKDESFKMEAELDELSSNYYQLTAFLPNILGNSLPQSLEKLGQVTAKGQAAVTENTLDTELTINTALGGGYTDIRLNNISASENADYAGVVSLTDFHMGKFISDENLGKVSLYFRVEGEGFTRETLNTEIIGEVSGIAYNNYNYKNLDVSGIVKDELFDGTLAANDKNLKLNFKGLVDFSQKTNKFDFTANVDHADLRRLNFISRDSISVFKGKFKIDMEGTTIDDVSGTVSFSKTSYTNQNANYYFEDFNVTSTFTEDERVLSINSPDIIKGEIKGKFYFNEAAKLVQNSIGSIYTNYSPYKITPDQHVEFNLNIYNKIVEVFYPGIDVGKNTSIKGNMTADEGEFKLVFKSPHIAVFNVVLDDINFQVDNKNPLFNTYIEVDKVATSLYDISGFNLINTKIKDTLFFRTEFKGGEDNSDAYNLNFYHTFNEDNKSVVGLKRSDVSFKENQWFLNEENNTKNKIVFDTAMDTISIREIVMNHENEKINLAGKLIGAAYKDIKLQFNEVSLDKITPSVEGFSLDGLVNGNLNIFQTGGNYLPSSNLVINDLVVNNNNMGVLNIGIEGKDNLSRYDVDINIINNDLKSFNVTGNINAADTKSPKLNLKASLESLNLEIFSPLGEDVISDIRGFTSGAVTVSGALKNPRINGELFLDDAGMRIPYLNVDVSLSNPTRVGLYNQTFEFNNAVLSDTSYDTQALLNGTISHKNFSDWYLDLKFDTQGNRFLVLNTQESEEALYYGTGFMDGTANIYGYADRLTVKVNAATGEGTSLKIPISDVATIGDTSFINFIDKNEKDTVATERELIDYTGLELDFDLDVNTNAEVEIVIDKKSGSTLRGKGAGNLLIEINTNGKFKMWGDFITYEGDYNFKYKGIINKPFKVLPGGTITWEGDPFDANIDMKAVYYLTANPAVLLENVNYTKKIDTEVEIQLEGNLEQIEPDFEIRFPGQNSVENSELQYHLAEKDKRQLQALSLLSQGTFIGEVGISQQAFTGNILQTATGLVNEILNDSDGKFDIGLSYEQGGRNPDSDRQIEDRLGINISTQISDRILVNGKIGVPVGGVTETVVAGDVEVQMLLNEDGSLSAKIFNRENEIQQFLAARPGYTQGVGLSYQVEFDTLKELLGKILKKSEKKKEKEEQELPEKTVGEGLINFSDKKEKKKSKSRPKSGSD